MPRSSLGQVLFQESAKPFDHVFGPGHVCQHSRLVHDCASENLGMAGHQLEKDQSAPAGPEDGMNLNPRTPACCPILWTALSASASDDAAMVGPHISPRNSAISINPIR